METGYYLVIKSVAERCGNVSNTYRIADGRFVETDRRLSRITLRPSEYISGISGIEKVSEERALTLIAANGYKKGVDNTAAADVPQTEMQELFPNAYKPSSQPIPEFVQEVIDGVRDADDVPTNDDAPAEEEEEAQVEETIKDEETEMVEGKEEQEEQVEAPAEEEEFVEVKDKKK